MDSPLDIVDRPPFLPPWDGLQQEAVIKNYEYIMKGGILILSLVACRKVFGKFIRERGAGFNNHM